MLLVEFDLWKDLDLCPIWHLPPRPLLLDTTSSLLVGFGFLAHHATLSLSGVQTKAPRFELP